MEVYWLFLHSRFVRNQIIFANTMFKVVCYQPDESQVITAGTDRKVRIFDLHILFQDSLFTSYPFPFSAFLSYG